MITAAIITLLIMINALYVAAEFAAVSVRRSRIQQRAEEGDALSRMLLPILSDAARLDRYIAACQIGITVSSLVLGAYGQAALATRLSPLLANLGGMQDVAAQSTAAILVLIFLTVFQMVIGELVPKSLALQFPTAVARYTVIPMRWSLRLLRWFIFVLNGSGLAILRVLGVKEVGHRHIHSPEEIEYLIAESRKGGYLRKDEHQRLRDALHLTTRQVGEVMVPRTRVQALDVDSTFDEILRTMTESPFTRMPVYSGSVDEILGIVHVESIASVRIGGSDVRDLRSMLLPIVVVPETMSLERVLVRLREARQHMAIVVDDFGGTAGLVTIGDVLSEIFGAMADEFKQDAPAGQRLPDGRIRLPGSMSLTAAAAWTGVWWQGDAYTAGGLVLAVLGRIPIAGDTLDIDGVAVEVERVSRHVIESILIVPARRREDRVG